MAISEILGNGLQRFGDCEVCDVARHDGIYLWFYNPNFVPDILGAEPFIPMEESKYSRR